MVRYLVVIERAAGNYSAYSPDLPGCVATGRTRGAVERRMAAAIAFHLRGLEADGLPIPAPRTVSGYVAVAPRKSRAVARAS